MAGFKIVVIVMVLTGMSLQKMTSARGNKKSPTNNKRQGQKLPNKFINLKHQTKDLVSALGNVSIPIDPSHYLLVKECPWLFSTRQCGGIASACLDGQRGVTQRLKVFQRLLKNASSCLREENTLAEEDVKLLKQADDVVHAITHYENHLRKNCNKCTYPKEDCEENVDKKKENLKIIARELQDFLTGHKTTNLVACGGKKKRNGKKKERKIIKSRTKNDEDNRRER